MNACQKRSVSCFACCGLANLNLDSDGLRTILRERTEHFESLNMDFARFPEYRKNREEKEQSIARHDPQTYVCPFLGYIEAGRPGCMIHPARTGQPTSQNYSFYGASICLSYDCRAKESEEQTGHTSYSDFLESRFPDLYHRLICDSGLFSLLETIPDFPDSVLEEPEGSQAVADRSSGADDLVRLVQLRLKHPDSSRITSFERLMVRSSDAGAAAESLFVGPDVDEALSILGRLKSLAAGARNH